MITATWSMIGAASIALAMVHALIWFRQPRSLAYLFFSIGALAAAGNAFAELSLLSADSIETYAGAMRWEVFFAGTLLIGITWCVQFYFGTARRWLALAITLSWIFLLLVNFFSPSSLVYREITSLQTGSLWGESYALATGTANPWNLPANVLPFIIILYVADASIRLWRVGNRSRAVTIGGSIVFFLFAAGFHATLVDHEILKTPYLVSFFYLAIVLAMGYELSSDILRSSQLAGEVKASERRWRALLENVNLLVAGVDKNGCINYVNPHFSEINGYPADEILGRPFTRMVPEEAREDVLARFKEAVAGNIRPRHQGVLLKKDGSTRIVMWSNVALRDPNGTVTGILSIGEDVTDLRKAEQELKDQKERMDIILSTLHTGLALMAPDMTVLWVNQKLREMMPWGDPVGKKCYAFAENREEPCERCGAIPAFADGRIHETVLQNTTDKHWYQIISLPVKDDQGRVASVLEATTDITDRMKAEEDLRESEEKYRIVADNTYDWEYWIGPDRQYRYIAPSCERTTGYSPDNFLREPGLRQRMIHPDDLEIFKTHLAAVEENREGGTLEFRIVRKDGAIRWINHVCQPVFGDDGEYLGVRGSNRDVTARKELEGSRHRAMRELEVLKAQLEAENIYLKEEFQEEHEFKEIVGKSNAILYVLGRVREVARTDSAVLIQGETGVGKELVARAIHDSGVRAKKPFIRVNCASLPVTLVESELFGHEPGAFTGAVKQRKGRFELADGGTLFLDEIAEMSMEMQAKLLHVLQDGEFQRVGGMHTLKSDVRVIAATNRSLQEEVAAGRFRADLYYRLNVFPITVPPLRQRREDIPLLVNHLVTQMAKRMGKNVDQIPNPVMEELKSYGWPGNVRELRNVLERALITSTDSVLRLSEGLQKKLPPPSESAATPDRFPSLEGLERKHILDVLESTNWRISGPKGAAKILGLNPSTLQSRLKKLGIRKNS